MTFGVRSIIRRATAGAVTLVVFAGCGGGAGDAVGPDGLTGSDVNAMVTALNGLGAFSFDFGLTAGQPLSQGLAAQIRNTPLARDVACAGGGAIHFAGNLETIFSGTQGAYIADVTQTHDACQTTMSNGRQWTFDGNPNVTLHTEYISNSATHIIRMLGSLHGSFAWRSASGASGVCVADVKLSGNAVPATRNEPGLGAITGQITGDICSRKVDVHY